jgi:hypothetical protein
MRHILAIGLFLSIIGCTSLPLKPYVDPQYGMTELQMFNLLGKPDSVEIYQKPDKTRMEVYIYVRNYELPQDKVPVCVIDKKVAGWGKTYYEDHISPDDIRIK